MPLVEQEFASRILSAWQGSLAFTELFEYCAQLEGARRYALSAVLYQTWLKRNQTPYNHFVLFNLGVDLTNEGDFAGARDAYLQAIQLAPAFLQPHNNLGLMYERLGEKDKAYEEWRWIDQNAAPEDPSHQAIRLQALNNLGRSLEEAGQLGGALEALTRSLTLAGDQPDALHHWVFLREKQCVWPIWGDVGQVAPELMRSSTSALAMLSLTDDPEVQLEAARNYVKAKLDPGVAALPSAPRYQHGKIRIGYLSGDFCLHPVAMLTAELFELHDREGFEVYGFCWSPEDGSGLRRRVVQAMDHFMRIDALDDEAAAKLIREQEIDILVDLQGQTRGARPDILSYRPAPVQITYLGLPATTGLPSIDYVIADRFLIPEESARYYSEKPLYMPDVYQVSDRKRVIAAAPTRQECGLPPKGFVYCSFNNNYKFNPDVFDVWMNILRAVPRSVLWLLADNRWAEANLKQEAEKRGIPQERILFAKRLPPDRYLARYAVPDLFLDTYPFNAGTTANDALWMGLPVLTCAGRSFASRMAGALLTAAGLEQLITYNLQDYQAKAIALGRSRTQCARIRKQLQQVREEGALFDTARFARNLEAAFRRLVV